MATRVKIDTDVKFTDNSTGKDVGVTYDWNFGDGTTEIDTTLNPIYHKYSTLGIKNITHSVKNPCNTTGVTCTSQQLEVVAELPSSGIGSTILIVLGAGIGLGVLYYITQKKK